MRIITVQTGEVLLTTACEKTIASHKSGADVFRFLDLGTRALEIEAGSAINEPTNYAVRAAIEACVGEIIKQGENKGLWKYKSDKGDIEGMQKTFETIIHKDQPIIRSEDDKETEQDSN
jgi:curli biogenesis system outer membrane secretion channel CsgG